jgi:hypothetical protein
MKASEMTRQICRGGFTLPPPRDRIEGQEVAMEDAGTLRQRAADHRTLARATPDLWESVIRFNLAAGYDALAARRDKPQAAEDRSASLARTG